jgi:transcriptional regulator with XRE-family HTH domain
VHEQRQRRRSDGVDGRPESERDPAQLPQFAALLNHLFATRLTPAGRPYTLTEVSKATGLSVPYLSILRKGTIDAVPFQRVAALARFFQVPLDYFSQEGSPAERLEALDREAQTQALGREFLLRAGKIGVTQRALVLEMLEHAARVLQALPEPPDEPHQPPQAEAPGAHPRQTDEEVDE